MKRIGKRAITTILMGILAAACSGCGEEGSSTKMGAGTGASFDLPMDVATDREGNVYVADSGNNAIRKITPAGGVTTLGDAARRERQAAGRAGHGFKGPEGVAFDGAGNIYVADSDNTIIKITPEKVVTILAGAPGKEGSIDGKGDAARFNEPSGIAADNAGNLYVADRANHVIRKITSAGVVITLAGAAGEPGHADGTGAAARFLRPADVAVDGRG